MKKQANGMTHAYPLSIISLVSCGYSHRGLTHVAKDENDGDQVIR